MRSPSLPPAFRRFVPPLVVALTLSLAGSLRGQTSPDPKAAAAEDDIVKLSPFTVSTARDQGYRASNSISGTRSNTPIRDIPVNIQVFTKEFSEDILATSQIGVERYNAALVNGGADVHSDNAIQQAYNAFLFRGFVQNWGLRDGIREYDPVDTQGLARIEIVKGPAAPLYGLAYPGGVMNSISKEVDFSGNFTALRLSAQTFGEYRASVDANYVGTVGNGGKFGIRFNAARTESKDQREHSSGMVRFTQLNLAWRPLPGTELKLIAENGLREKPAGLGYFSRGGANGADTPLQVVHPDIPWTWNWADKYNMRDDDTKKYRGTITQSVGENFTVTAYLETNGHNQTDSDGWDAAGGGGSAASWDLGWANSPLGGVATGWMTNSAGQEVIRKAYHHRDWCNSVHAYGIMGVYKLDTGAMKNTIAVGSNVWAEKFHSVKGTTKAGSIQVSDFPISTTVDTSGVLKFPPSDYYIDIGATPDENSSNDYYYLSWQGALLDNRLKLNAAINHTNIKLIQHVAPAKVTKISKNSPLIGAMFDVTKEVSLFATHSSSLFPTTDKNDFDVQMPAKTGKGNEMGVKIETLEGKISGTISYYQIEETGGSMRDPKAINRDKTTWDANVSAGRAGSDGLASKYGWPVGQIPAGGEGGYVAWASASTAQKTAARDSLQDRAGGLGDIVPNPNGNKSKGYEADLVFQPNKNWQLMLSYAHNTVTIIPDGHVKDQVAMLTKYTFTEGAASGLSLGLGLQKVGQAARDSGTRFDPSALYVETFATYKFKSAGYTHRFQLNVKNLTKQAEYVGWYAKSGETLASHRYEVPTKVIATLTYGIDF